MASIFLISTVFFFILSVLPLVKDYSWLRKHTLFISIVFVYYETNTSAWYTEKKNYKFSFHQYQIVSMQILKTKFSKALKLSIFFFGN